MPPAAAVSPPVSTPSRPLLFTAFTTPWASRCPKPSSGTVAPAPANSASGAYQPRALSTTPATTKLTRMRAGVSLVRSMSSCPTTQMAPPTQNARK